LNIKASEMQGKKGKIHIVGVVDTMKTSSVKSLLKLSHPLWNCLSSVSVLCTLHNVFPSLALHWLSWLHRKEVTQQA
jgi:hypothetical protein